MKLLKILSQSGTRLKTAVLALLCALCASVAKCPAQTSGPYVVMPGIQTAGMSTWPAIAQFQANPIGNTNLFYGLFCNFSSIGNGSPRGVGYIAESAYANTNWNLITPDPVYIDPDFLSTNQYGPALGTGGGVTEMDGCLYMVYQRVGGTGTTPAQLGIASSMDMTNWTLIGTWTANDGWTNSFYDSPNWSQVNYGGTNWIVFGYNTNQPGIIFGPGEISVLPVSLTPTNAVFGQLVSICTNIPNAANMAGAYTIITNGGPAANGTFVYEIPFTTSTTGNHPLYSTNFFGPYTNLAAWTMPSINTDFTPWLLSISNNSVWYWWANGEISVSSNFGTNWTTLSTQPLYLLNRAFVGNSSGFGIATKPEGIFWLTSPLRDPSASIVQGVDGHFTGTLSAANMTAETVHSANGIFNNISVSGVAMGTARQPFTAPDGMDWGNGVTNSGWFNMVGGQNISVGPDANGGVFLGGGYTSDDSGGITGGGAVFEFEDGNSPVNSPNGGPFGSEEGLFYVNAQQIIFAQGPINSKAGYQANGTAGVTQNLAVQTNSSGPHGITLEFKNGLYVGQAPY